MGATGIGAGLSLSNGTLNQSGLAIVGCQFAGLRRERLDGRRLVVSGSTQSYTATLTTGTLGPQSQTFSMNVGDDHTLAGASHQRLSTTAALTVLDHSNASLSSSSNSNHADDQLRQRAEGGDHPQPEFHDLQPGGKHLGRLHGEPETDRLLDNRRCGIDHEPFDLQRACSGQRHHLYRFAEHQQLHHDGNHDHHACPLPNWSTTAVCREPETTTTGHHRHAARQRRQRHRRQEQFADFLRHPLDRPVAQNASYANLESKATATTGSGGYGMVGSTATILAGTNSSGSAQTVSMAWRTADVRRNELAQDC